MQTKLHQKTENKPKMPAGIFSGTEAFWHNNEKWVFHEGQAMLFDDAPLKVRNMIAMAFINDKDAKAYLKKIGADAFAKGFELWYRCKVGALDSIPDFLEGKFFPDAFNNSCTDYDCPHRGKFCSLASGLKNYEVKSLAALKEGCTIEEAADKLHVSTAGMKSRIEKMKEKLNARNVAQLTAIAAEMGI